YISCPDHPGSPEPKTDKQNENPESQRDGQKLQGPPLVPDSQAVCGQEGRAGGSSGRQQSIWDFTFPHIPPKYGGQEDRGRTPLIHRIPPLLDISSLFAFCSQTVD